jgi:hypothetical protein
MPPFCQKREIRGRARVASAVVLRRPVPEILTPSQLIRPLPALQMPFGRFSCMGELLSLATSSNCRVATVSLVK